jgi:L,D-peptidoglycan transpeptidase YkuD (ErfK/YbiS/YcfS/YnhG family)
MVGMPNPLPGPSRASAVSRARVPVLGAVIIALLAVLVVTPGGSAGARSDLAVPTTGPAPHSTPSTDAAAAGQAPAPRAEASAPVPAFASRVPARTRQVVRTVRSRRWCARRYCTITQAWRKAPDGRWEKVRRFRSTIGPNGFGKTREGDNRSPSGVYRIKVTFSTGRSAPGPMPWRRRLPTSTVTNYHNRYYNTWIEERGRTDGDRPSMRYGFIVDYNNPRLRVGVGPKPVIGKGSGIFYHTSRPGQRWIPTLGCTQLGNPRSMRWVVRWLDPDAHPRVVQDL